MSPRELEVYNLCLKRGKPRGSIVVEAADLEGSLTLSRDRITRILRSLVEQNMATRVSKSPSRFLIHPPTLGSVPVSHLGALLRRVHQILVEQEVLEEQYRNVVLELRAAGIEL